jgi:solute carrier family 25 carnitine/acylcarnitine transporter 20/29
MSVGQKHPFLEAFYGSLSGLAFGLLSPLASQPFDTLKTKMQAEAQFAKKGPLEVARTLFKVEGARGFYAGMLPILLSTGVQKSALFAGYAGAKRWCEQSQIQFLTDPLPWCKGMNLSVVVGSIAASTTRTLVETPFELAKVRSQTGGSFRSLCPSLFRGTACRVLHGSGGDVV